VPSPLINYLSTCHIFAIPTQAKVPSLFRAGSRLAKNGLKNDSRTLIWQRLNANRETKQRARRGFPALPGLAFRLSHFVRAVVKYSMYEEDLEEIERESERLFRSLDLELYEYVDEQYFKEPREFRSLIQVLEVLGAKVEQMSDLKGDELLAELKDANPAYSRLLEQRERVANVIESVVKFQHGGLNNTVETMTDVVKEYNRGREDVRGLRRSLEETQDVLTAKKSGQISMRDLWLKKVETEESLRILQDLEFLKEMPPKLQRLMQQRRYLSAVTNLNKALDVMFGEDLITVGGLNTIREQLMDLKGVILESIVSELQDVILGMGDEMQKDEEADSDFEEDEDDGGGGGGGVGHEKDPLYQQHLQLQHHNQQLQQQRLLEDGENDVEVQNTSALGSLELLELDEDIEQALVDPTSPESSSIFIRLLIRAVGGLSFEDDVERMLLDNAASRFTVVVKRLREHALLRKAKKLRGTGDEYTMISKLFTAYISSLLDAAILILRRLLYVLRLLSVMRRTRTKEGNPLEYEWKDFNRRLVLELWEDIESAIVFELKIHFVEKSVEDITDSSIAAMGASMASAGTTEIRGLSADDADEKDDTGEDPTPIFPPSARLVAPIYKKIVTFGAVVDAIMVSEGVHNPKAHISANQGKGISVMEALAAAGTHDKPFESKVLANVQIYLEDELMPLVQLTVNGELRELQLNNHLFSHSLAQAAGGSGGGRGGSSRLDADVPICQAALSCYRAAYPLYSYWLQLPQHCDMVVTILERLVRGYASSAREELDAISWKLMAAEDRYKTKVLAAMKKDPLFIDYKIQVYDGKASIDELIAGRDRPDGGGVIAGGGGVRGSSVLDNSQARNRRSSSAGLDGTPLNFYFSSSPSNALELEAWGKLWEVGLVSYPTTSNEGGAGGKKEASGGESSDKILKDFMAVGTISSIVHGSDWLAYQMCKMCSQITKKATTAAQAAAAAKAGMTGASGIGSSSSSASAPSSSSPPRGNETSASLRAIASFIPPPSNTQKTKTLKQTLQEEHAPLWAAVQAGVKDLAKLSEEGLALIRGEIQVACFHYLHQLAHIKFGASGGSKSSSSNDATHEAETLIAGLNQHLLSFQDAAQACIQPHALAVMWSPLCSLMPRLLLKCILHLCHTGALSEGDRHKPLRMVVACQQSMSMLLEQSRIELSASENKNGGGGGGSGGGGGGGAGGSGMSGDNYSLQEIVTEEFEHVRKFVTLLDVPVSELRTYMSHNKDEYTVEEFSLLYKVCVCVCVVCVCVRMCVCVCMYVCVYIYICTFLETLSLTHTKFAQFTHFTSHLFSNTHKHTGRFIPLARVAYVVRKGVGADIARKC